MNKGSLKNLKSCPWCKRTNFLRLVKTYDSTEIESAYYAINCDFCGVLGPNRCFTKIGAKRTWNRRKKVKFKWDKKIK